MVLYRIDGTRGGWVWGTPLGVGLTVLLCVLVSVYMHTCGNAYDNYTMHYYNHAECYD